MAQLLEQEFIVPIIQPHVSGENMGHFQKVLVLNQNYMPLTIARIPRALSLLNRRKAEVLEHGVEPIQTSSCSIPRPSVIRLVNYIKRPRPKLRLTRQQLFKRDGYQCQYCGKWPKELTIDHVLPLSRGGQDSWTNWTTSCKPCNKRKGARTPEEAHMPLRRLPFEPQVSQYLHLIGADVRPEWAPFLP